MTRAALTPSRQLVVGATTVAVALATIVTGVWLAATGTPRLEPANGRARATSAPAALIEAAGSGLALELLAPDSILDLLEATPRALEPADEMSPGGGLAVQPPALPPPPSPPPGANPPPEPDPDPVTALVETVEETSGDLEDAIDEVMGEEPLSSTTLLMQ